jgi:DNA-binding response OmpR family regulator
MKPSIFLVEDDPDISRLVCHHLESGGFGVRVFPTGNIVIAESERTNPALFILDIMVPGKDGLELCRQIRHIPGLAAIPVIFLTARSGEADKVLGLEMGADDYISKPLLEYFARHAGRVFTRDQLLDSVWRDTAFVTPRSVDVYVRRIREKIEPDPENPRYLKTVRGAGYRFEAPK